MLIRLLALSFGLAAAGAAQTPPPQPASGPGGSDYPHAEVAVKGPYIPARYGGDPEYAYYLFEPVAPKPAEAPVVLFLHGFLSGSPFLYADWIEHIVRKGYTVAWVRWDQGLITTDRFIDQAERGWRAALRRLRLRPLEGHVRPALDPYGAPLTAVVGHSAGAWIGASLAGRARFPWKRLPVPRAVFAVEPQRPLLPHLEPIEAIDPATKLLVLIGDDDTIVCDGSARHLWRRTAQVPDSDRDYLVTRSDAYGGPALAADHLLPFAPSLPGAADALDFFGTWKLSVALFDCAFGGVNCGMALGNGAPEQVELGRWSDGTPAAELLWLPAPEAYTPACRP